MDLYAERSRLLEVTDPDTRLATLSCGAALHHARVGLAARGWHTSVARMPNPAEPTHLAQLRVDWPVPVDPQAVRHVRTIRLRHTDRRPVTGTPVRRDDLQAITASAETEGTGLHILRPDQLFELAAAADYAQRTEAAESPWQAELAYWTGGGRGEPFADLTQVAVIGLIKAADRCDANRGVPFASYATPTILGGIKRHFRDSAWTYGCRGGCRN